MARTQKPRTRARRILRWIVRIGVGAVALVVLAVALAIGYVHTSWGRDRIRREIEVQLASSFPHAKVRSLEGSVFGVLTARGIELPGEDGQSFIEISSLRVEVGILPLAGKTVRVEELTVDGLVVHVREQPDKKKPAKPEAAPSAWAVEVPKVVVKNARVIIEPTKPGEQAEIIDGLTASGSLSHVRDVLGGNFSASARWRDQAIDANASVRVDKTVDVPFALVTLGSASAKASVSAYAIRIDGTKIDGVISARAPAVLVKTLADTEVPGDIAVGVRMRRDGAFSLTGTSGTARVDAVGVADLEKLTARGLATASLPDLASLSKGTVIGAGTAVAAIDATELEVRGLVSFVGHTESKEVDVRAGAIVAIDARFDTRTAFYTTTHLVAAGRATIVEPVGPTLPRGSSSLASFSSEAWLSGKDGRELLLVKSETIASSSGLPGGVGGRFELELEAAGTLSPVTALDARGTFDGRGIRHVTTGTPIEVARARAVFMTRVEGETTKASAQLDVSGIRQGPISIPTASIDAGVIAAKTIEIDLGTHRIRTADGKTFSGSGGHISIDDHALDITNVQTATKAGTGKPSRITASAKLSRDTEDLDVAITARDIAVAMLDPKSTGIVNGDLKISRRGDRWNGGGTIVATKITAPAQPPFDAKLSLSVANRRVIAEGTATSPTVGGATIAVDVTGPRDLTDTDAWMRLPRNAVTRASIALEKIDLKGLRPTAVGTVDGEVTIGAHEAGGSVRVTGVATQAGEVTANLSLAPGANDTIVAHATTGVAGIASATGHATFALPARPFDPLAWKQVRANVLREAVVKTTVIAIDPAMLARFGKTADLRGTASASVTVGEGAKDAKLVVTVSQLRGPDLKAPIEAKLVATVDDKGLATEATATSGGVAITLGGRSPITIDTVIDGKTRTVPLDATLTIPETEARALLALLGRKDVTAGKVGGTVTVKGTIGAPAVHANLAATGITIVPTLATKKPPKLDRLELDARWAKNSEAQLELRAYEPEGRMLEISARGKDTLASVTATMQAANFEIAPLAAFAPGALGAARGILNAAVTVKGLDPQSGMVTGMIHVTDGRTPLAPTIGNLRKADIDITIESKRVTAILDGKLGAGSVKGKASAVLSGGLPTTADFSIALKKVSPIGAVQPVIDGELGGKFTRTGTKWRGKITWRKGNIYVPPEIGNELLATGAPGDMIFVDAAKVVPKVRRMPRDPWLFATIEIGETRIVVEDKDFEFAGTAKGHLELKLGSGMSVEGAIETERGDVTIVGRRYQLDHGVVDFDGLLDPRLDIRLTHTFKEGTTLNVDVTGRSSAPDLRLSSDPAKFTPGQLLAFLSGAEPGDSSSGDLDQAVKGGSFAFFSSRLGKKVTKYIPFIKFDTLSYEAKTASSSQAIKFGKRLGEKSFLIWRLRPEARTDENPGEASLEYYFLPSLLLESTAGQRGGGADLLWRKRW